jgi:two-component system, sensor histidine kinase
MGKELDNTLRQAGREQEEVALFRLGYKNQVPGAAISLIVILLLVFGYGGNLPRPSLWYWFAWMMGVEAIGWVNRWAAARSARQGLSEAEFGRRWRRVYAWQLMLGGIGWGNVGLLYGDSLAHNAILLIVFFGIASQGSNLSAAHHFRAMLMSMPPAILFQILYLPRAFGELALALQGMLLVYLLLLIFSGRNIHRHVVENIRLRFDNEEILREKIDEARRADQANLEKSQFLAAASHDLRQPVHALLLLVAAMRQRCTEAAQLELIGHIQQAGQAIVKLFNALMEISRLETGAEVPDPQPIAMTDLLDQVLARHLPEASQKGLRLDLAVSRRAGHLRISTDRILFGRIIDNIVSNALRYTQAGRVLMSLRTRGDGAVWLDVRDTGIGIAEHDIARIFEPYVQIGNAERDRTKGLGLGLAIVQQISTLLDCPVEVRSRPGSGSLFRIHLTRLRIGDQPPRPLAVERPPVQPMLRSRRILVIDDDVMVQHAMKVILGSWEAEVRVAGRDSDVAALVDDVRWKPDCVLCDYRLPGETNGIELLNQLTERFPHAMGILQTGELDPAVHEQAEEAGYLLLKKPVSPDLLGATLHGCLASDLKEEDDVQCAS